MVISCRSRKLYFALLVCSLNLLPSFPVAAQLSLNQTHWICIRPENLLGQIGLEFSRDSLKIKHLAANQTLGAFLFQQTHDSLLLYDLRGQLGQRRHAAIYRLQYEHGAQRLAFVSLKATSATKGALLTFPAIFDYQPSEGSAPRDWLQLDPTADSVAGISLYRAYELLKGRPSKPVIVAVIDNGVDVNHEDLKNRIWTNTKEIPDNGIDDDHNGYIDDVHGWNFRGAADGTIIENEQAGETQVVSAWKQKYDKADTSLLNPSEKIEYHEFQQAKSAMLRKISNSTDSNDVKYAYNIDYHSSALIANDAQVENNRFYGSPYYKLSPLLSHGTHVAGIIGAQRNNHIGMDGIADNVLIMPIVATTARGDERDKDVANAIRYAVDNGAQVINMSFSKIFSSDKSLVDEAIRYADDKNVLIIHSAGNDGVDIDSSTNDHYPTANYLDGTKADNFLTVGWNRPAFNYRLAHPLSNYGKTNVDLFAPGSDIFSTVPNDAYDFKSGSSMSTPCVTAVAALLFSYFPSLSSAQVKKIILESTFKPKQLVNRPQSNVQVPFSSLSASGGILNAYQAVTLALEITGKKIPG